MAPLDRAAEGPLAFRKIAGPGGQEAKPRSQSSKDRVRSENFGSAGGQLDRQREPLESQRDLGDAGRVFGGQLRPWADGRSSLHEERHGLVPRKSPEIQR